MKHKIITLLLAAFNLFAIIYLLSPPPSFPDLTSSVKSDLPGDTVQLKNVNAYFTNQSRNEVIDFYLHHYSGLLRIRLNHPPEKVKEIIRDTAQSTYLEELVLPFKESVFISGYEWQTDPFTKPEKRIVNKILYENKEYFAKITIKTFPVTLARRILTLFLLEFILIAIILSYKKYFSLNQHE